MRLLLLVLIASLGTFAQTRLERVATNAESLRARVLADRRYFHAHPELSNREEHTAAAIAERLKSLGLEVRTGIARHGVIGILKGGKPGPVVAWRADIDALPIDETIDKPYKSVNKGVKHACGHDAHIAIALSVVETLVKMRDQIPGTVKFIFQPAEEGAPTGEPGGATLMIKEGALENPKPQAIFGLHVSTWGEAGKINYSSGPAMASADILEIKLKGKKTHAAFPHQGIDTVVVAAECVMALQTIRSRRVDPSEPMVLTIGSMHGGNRFNIIADEVILQGTVRTLSESVRESVRTMVRQTLEGCTAMNQASFELQWHEPSYPVTFNDPKLTSENLASLRQAIGTANVVEAKATMGSEDFSYYQRIIPGFFWFLGASNSAKGITAAHHTADFDIDEDILVPGVKAAANQLLDYLERTSKN